MSKKYISRTLRMIAYFWISLPVTYLVLARTAMSIHLSDEIKIVLSPWFWIISVIAVVSALGVLRIRWYGWSLFLFSHLTVTYQTALALVHYSHAPHRLFIFLSTVVVQSLMVYVVGREIRVPYFFPKIRWWESDPRYKLSVQTKLIREDESELEGEIMDLSLGGCFVKTHSYFIPDEVLRLDFTLFEKVVQCSGKVVWRTESTVTHPKGIGIKFETLSKENAQCIKQATRKLKKLARTYSQLTRERNWQEYLAREQRYQAKSGGGASISSVQASRDSRENKKQ
jgi:hypothetical protein